MSDDSPSDVTVDTNALRKEVKIKYREVALDPHSKYHFHTGRYLAKHLGYDENFVGSLPDAAVESFSGVANPFSLQPLAEGERVVDVGSGAGQPWLNEPNANKVRKSTLWWCRLRASGWLCCARKEPQCDRYTRSGSNRLRWNYPSTLLR